MKKRIAIVVVIVAVAVSLAAYMGAFGKPAEVDPSFLVPK